MSAIARQLFVATVLLSSLLTCSGLRPCMARAETVQQVIVPDEDRFEPFGLTIHVGDTVEWVNTDTDDHTVVSDNALNSIRTGRINHKILGTDNNGGQPGTFS